MSATITIRADRDGFSPKEQVVQELAAPGFQPPDQGTHGPGAGDCADFAQPVARIEETALNA
ncbi:MAG TPA: hypothetical protein VGQ17_06020 [Gemmatimonadales bacterium]|jgi:ribose 5-phosphate isomerase RpiB|nr:hypothetical protein [Gemmatimonadales bacterium]